MRLIIERHNSFSEGESDVSQMVLLICKQIRFAMDKQMRIFCSDLLTKVRGITNTIISQMMKKEDAAYTKFTQIGTEKEEREKRSKRRVVCSKED